MKTIGIYPGNFQPAHRGHVTAYRKFKQLAGADTFIVTTDKTPTPDAPLNFGEKEQIWVRHGAPASHIVKVQDWKHPVEVFHRFSPKHTNAIFALNHKEMEEVATRKSIQPPKDGMSEKEVWTNIDGTPAYFQPYKGNERSMESMDKHGYATLIEDNLIDGKPISTANIRDGIASAKYTDVQRKKFFIWAFGWFDIGLYQTLSDKFKLAHTNVEKPEPKQSSQSVTSTQLKEIVNSVLDELAGVSPLSTPSGDDPDAGAMPTDSEGLPGEADRAQNAALARQDASKMKRAAERDLKTLKADLKWKEADVTRKRRDEIPNKIKDIDTINKTISSVGR